MKQIDAKIKAQIPVEALPFTFRSMRERSLLLNTAEMQ